MILFSHQALIKKNKFTNKTEVVIFLWIIHKILYLKFRIKKMKKLNNNKYVMKVLFKILWNKIKK